MPSYARRQEAVVNVVRSVASVGIAVSAMVFIATWLAAESRAQAPERAALAGGWTMNHDLSDRALARPEGDNNTDNRRDEARGRRGGGGGGYRGGYGGRRGGGGQGAAPAMNPDEMARMRDAIRDITDPPEHFVIVQTDSMVIFTGPDG